MTLRQLKSAVVPADETKRVPGAKDLRAHGEIFVKEILTDGGEVTVYTNGFVLYSNGSMVTVFPLHSCGGVSYEFANGQCACMRSNVFEDEAWYFRLIMEGESRLESNYDRTLRSHCVSYSEYKDDSYIFSDNTQDLCESFFEKDLLDKIQEFLNVREWDIFYRIHVVGELVKDIAKDYGLTPQAVSQINQRTKKKLRNMLERQGYKKF